MYNPDARQLAIFRSAISLHCFPGDPNRRQRYQLQIYRRIELRCRKNGRMESDAFCHLANSLDERCRPPLLYYGPWQVLNCHWIGEQIKQTVPWPTALISNIVHMHVHLTPYSSTHGSQAVVRDSGCEVRRIENNCIPGLIVEGLIVLYNNDKNYLWIARGSCTIPLHASQPYFDKLSVRSKKRASKLVPAHDVRTKQTKHQATSFHFKNTASR